MRREKIKNPLLLKIYMRDAYAVQAEVDEIRFVEPSDEDGSEMQHDMILAFWFAVHLEEVEITNIICEKDYMLK